MTSESTGPIFTKFSPYSKYLIVDYRSDPFYGRLKGRCRPWQPILESKLVKSDNSPLFVVLAFRNGLQYRRCDFKEFISDDLATSCKHLVNLLQ